MRKTKAVELVSEVLSTEEKLQAALQAIEQRDQQITELTKRLHTHLKSKDDPNKDRLDGWFVSGPSSTAIMFSRHRIPAMVQVLCGLNGDKPEDYQLSRVAVHIENLKSA